MSDQHSKLLINEEPLQLLPSLAKLIGFNEAVVLQQLQFWMRNPKIGVTRADGRKWVYNTYEEWQRDNFPFWSVDTVKRAFLNLESQRVILSDKPGGRDRKKWYTIDYDALNRIIKPEPGAQSPPLSVPEAAPDTSGETAPMHRGKLPLSDGAKSADASGQNPPMEEGNPPRPSAQNPPFLSKVSENTSESTREHPPSARSAPHPATHGPAERERRSKFSFPERLAYYRQKPGVKDPEALANTAWVREGDADEEIGRFLSRTPAEVEAARSAPPDNRMKLGEARAHVRSILDFDAGHDPAAVITQLFDTGKIGEQTRDELLAEFCAAAAARGSP